MDKSEMRKFYRRLGYGVARGATGEIVAAFANYQAALEYAGSQRTEHYVVDFNFQYSNVSYFPCDFSRFYDRANPRPIVNIQGTPFKQIPNDIDVEGVFYGY